MLLYEARLLEFTDLEYLIYLIIICLLGHQDYIKRYSNRFHYITALLLFLIYTLNRVKHEPLHTENQIGNYVSGDFCHYWNLNSQISDNFDILIMVSKAKFEKKLNGQTRFT